jgi:uncharacterized protein (DUF1015 family)
MVTIDPVTVALVPVDSRAADELGAPNYDEFQSDREVWELLRIRPLSVLRVTMPHCDVRTPEDIGEEGSKATLARAAANMARLLGDPRVRRVRNMLWVYEITRPDHPDRPQLGLGGLARTDEIRTAEHLDRPIIRNEEIREAKARGRAVLTEVTHTDMGTVNLAVDDEAGSFQSALSECTRAAEADFETVDEGGDRHRIWIVREPATVARLRALLAAEQRAYVADGNHRSAAAAMLGLSHFLSVVFPCRTMTIAPYNRLVHAPLPSEVAGALADRFEIAAATGPGPYQPSETHHIGLYDGTRWWRLSPRSGSFDAGDAAQSIDADIVQRLLFEAMLGIADARDERISYVGANRDAAWLQAEVDAGRFGCAVTLPAVTMRQFVDVCRQNRLMPPKSTWFVPKVRSGLVMSLLQDGS